MIQLESDRSPQTLPITLNFSILSDPSSVFHPAGEEMRNPEKLRYPQQNALWLKSVL